MKPLIRCFGIAVEAKGKRVISYLLHRTDNLVDVDRAAADRMAERTADRQIGPADGILILFVTRKRHP